VLAIAVVRAAAGDALEFQNAALLVDRQDMSTSSTDVRTGIQASGSSINPGGPVQSLTTASTTATSTEVRTGVQAPSSTIQPGGPIMSTTMPSSSASSTEVRTGVQASSTSSGATSTATTTSDAGRMNGLSVALALSVVVGGLVVIMA